MNLIHSRDIYYVIRDVLKCLDANVISHGSRTSYILSRMLLCMNKYEMYEVAELAMVATLHDIGAYKTDNLEDRLRYESKEYMPHSIYGYMYLSYLTPLKDQAKIVLYHHTDYDKIRDTSYEYLEVAHCLNIAEKMDIYSNILGAKFDYMMFQKQVGTKFSPKAMDLLYQAQKKYNIFEKLNSGEYKSELSELYEYLIFTNEEKHDYLMGLMYCVGFRSEYTMYDILTCTHICEQLGEKFLLSKEDAEILRYASILHDAGMAGVPKDVIEAPRKLTSEEMQSLREHVSTVESMLRGRLKQECLDVILMHHERGDGSGYPNRLREYQIPRLASILQVADTVTGLTSPRSYREPKTKEQVIMILKEEAGRGKLNAEVVRAFISFYDRIMEGVRQKSDETLETYKRFQTNYELTYKQISK